MFSGERSGAVVAVEPGAPGSTGGCVGLDATAVADLAGDDETQWWHRAAAGVRQAAPDVARLVVVLPASWFDSGVDGARRRERARGVLVEVAGLPLAGLLPLPDAVAARHEAAGERRVTLVAHIAPQEVGLARYDGTAGGVRVSWSGREPAAAPWPALSGTDPEDVYAALRHGRRRLDVALAAAARNPAFLDVPVAGAPGVPPRQWHTAREVRDAFAARRSALALLLQRFGDASPSVAGEPGTTSRVVVAGPDRRDPLAHEALQDAARRPAAAPPAVEVAAPADAAEGAALVAAGRVAVRRPAPRLTLPLHRFAGGRPEPADLPLDAGGSGAPGELDGTPVTVEVTGDGPPAGLFGRLGVSGADAVAVPAGTYRVAAWPDDGGGGATLVLRPVDGGPATFVAVTPRAEALHGEGTA